MRRYVFIRRKPVYRWLLMALVIGLFAWPGVSPQASHPLSKLDAATPYLSIIPALPSLRRS